MAHLQRIFSTLNRYNRLNFPRLKAYSRLTDRQLLHGLSAMIQHRLVFHYTAYDDGVTYYEANLQSAYYLVRSGKIVELIWDNLGDYAAAVMSAIMFLGHTQISYLETLPELQASRPKPNGIMEEYEDQEEPEDRDDGDEQDDQVNGVNGNHDPGQTAPLHSTLKTLAAHGYITRVREAHFQSHNDNVLDAERTIKSRADVKQLKGKKFDEAVIEGTINLVRERTSGDLSQGLMVGGVPRGAKRRHGAGNTDSPNKKGRMDYAAIDEDEDEDQEENEWSDDEMGDGAIPMQVSLAEAMGFVW